VTNSGFPAQGRKSGPVRFTQWVHSSAVPAPHTQPVYGDSVDVAQHQRSPLSPVQRVLNHAKVSALKPPLPPAASMLACRACVGCAGPGGRHSQRVLQLCDGTVMLTLVLALGSS